MSFSVLIQRGDRSAAQWWKGNGLVSIEAWMAGGAIAFVCGALLSVAFKLSAVIVASFGTVIAGLWYARAVNASVATQFGFVVLLLFAMQAAYLAGLFLRSRAKK